ncbi:MAG TPA: D-Ala-D-Ala carboxypeptidase family metallohydrolase [Planctomycetota bacterium]|nr:D-Ala-D-Ala carboxypeptidase family metallohydrolase [Planctomycetota bacterium]
MRTLSFLAAVAALLAMGACRPGGPGQEAEGRGSGPSDPGLWMDDAPHGPRPPTSQVPGGHKPPDAPEPAAVTDQHLEVTVEGCPGLSGGFWAWDTICLPPGGKVALTPLRPGHSLALSAPDAWRQAGGGATPGPGGALELRVPAQPGGRYRLEMRGPSRAAFWMCVLTEARVERDRRGGAWQLSIGRDPLGTYPNPADSKSRLVREHRSDYEPPRYFLKLDKTSEKLQLAPHLLAGQMVSFIEVNRAKTDRRHTSWFPPNRPLIEKLERLSRELAAGGVKFRRLVINSGFRTPVHNRGVQGGVNSRHIFGDAADVMIDEDGDDRMDDINRDGVCDYRDALVIAQALRKLELAGKVKPGGIGVYGYDTTESCAAFVHMDSRGFITRWGTNHKRGRAQKLDWWPPEEFKEDEED